MSHAAPSAAQLTTPFITESAAPPMASPAMSPAAPTAAPPTFPPIPTREPAEQMRVGILHTDFAVRAESPRWPLRSDALSACALLEAPRVVTTTSSVASAALRHMTERLEA